LPRNGREKEYERENDAFSIDISNGQEYVGDGRSFPYFSIISQESGRNLFNVLRLLNWKHILGDLG